MLQFWTICRKVCCQSETECAAQSKTLGLKLESVVQEPPPQDTFLLGENYLPCPVFRPLYSETGAISATTAKEP